MDWRAFGCSEVSFRKSRSEEGKGGGGGSRRTNLAPVWSKVLQEVVGARTAGALGTVDGMSRKRCSKRRKQDVWGHSGKVEKLLEGAWG